MKILIAGGAGMIGSHLCEQLIMEEHNVICIDNLCTGRIGNIRRWLDNPLFTFIEHDIIGELPALPHVETLAVVELMDTMRERIGLRYPFE